MPRQHQHRHQLGKFRRLADAHPSDGEPALGAGRGAGAGADEQHRDQQEHAQHICRRGHPLDEAERSLERSKAGHQPHPDPHELPHPDALGVGDDISLPGAVEDQHAVGDEQERHAEQRPVQASWGHRGGSGWIGLESGVAGGIGRGPESVVSMARGALSRTTGVSGR